MSNYVLTPQDPPPTTRRRNTRAANKELFSAIEGQLRSLPGTWFKVPTDNFVSSNPKLSSLQTLLCGWLRRRAITIETEIHNGELFARAAAIEGANHV